MSEEIKRGRGRPRKEKNLEELRMEKVKQAEGKRRRGRPTKDEALEHKALIEASKSQVFKNKRSYDHIKAFDPDIPETEVAKMNKFSIELMKIGRDKISWTDENAPDEIQDRFIRMYNLCAEMNIKPSIPFFAMALHITRPTLINYIGANSTSRKNDACVETIKLCLNMIAGNIEAYMVDNHINTVAGIFLLKNSNMGYKDTQDVVLQNVENESKTDDELIKGAELLPTDDDNIIDVEIEE